MEIFTIHLEYPRKNLPGKVDNPKPLQIEHFNDSPFFRGLFNEVFSPCYAPLSLMSGLNIHRWIYDRSFVSLILAGIRRVSLERLIVNYENRLNRDRSQKNYINIRVLIKVSKDLSGIGCWRDVLVKRPRGC
jgi:hypothetical protein